MTYQGHIENGSVVLDAPVELPEGVRVEVLIQQRTDKQWSLTDCASILILQMEGIDKVLTHDKHFIQAEFTALMREENKQNFQEYI